MSDYLTPQNEKQLSEFVTSAYNDNISLRIVGGGTRLKIGNIVKADKQISLAKLNKITLYEPGALTLVAQAGVKYKEIEKTLKSAGQRLAFEPIDHRDIFSSSGEPTIGSIVAGNFSGPRRIRVGACRDFLLGVRFVSGEGKIIKNGGRVMKNVTGLDLVKLMAGSFGTLGIISEVSFKTLPIPQRELTLLIEGLNSQQAIDLFSEALASPYEISGASHFSENNGKTKTYLRVEGFDSQVNYRLEKIKKTFSSNYEIDIVDGVKHDNLWKKIRNVAMFKGSNKPLWRILTKPTNAPQIERELIDKTGAKIIFDWGGSLIWAQMEEENNAHSDAVRYICAQNKAQSNLIRASDKVKEKLDVFHPQPEMVAKLSNCIRKKFDPKSILNPSLIFRVER